MPWLRWPAAHTIPLVADIPSLDLNGRHASPVSPVRGQSPSNSSTAATGGGSAPSSRRTSFSSIGRASASGRQSSSSSSRSTSFNLPNEARDLIRIDNQQGSDEVEFDEDMDEESKFSPYLPSSFVSNPNLIAAFVSISRCQTCRFRARPWKALLQ